MWLKYILSHKFYKSMWLYEQMIKSPCKLRRAFERRALMVHFRKLHCIPLGPRHFKNHMFKSVCIKPKGYILFIGYV